MGILSRLFKPQPKPEPPFTAGNPLAQLAGTTTNRAAAAQEVMVRHGQNPPGFIETTGQLVRTDAGVDVTVDGTPIGHLWTVSVSALAPQSFDRTVPVQMFSDVIDEKLRVEAWAWLAPTAPEWEWSAGNRPPMTAASKAAQRTADTREMLREQAASSSYQAERIAAGTVGGVHYLELVEPIEQAKREGRNEDALALCYQAIEGAERGRDGREPAPAYTKHAAIVLRKLKRPNEEAAVLERYLRWLPEEHRASHQFTERLAKVRELQQRAQG